MRPSRSLSRKLPVRSTTCLGVLALFAAVATANCGDGDQLPDGGLDGGPDGTTDGGRPTDGGRDADADAARDATVDADANPGDADADAGPSGRALESTVTSTGLDTKLALGRGFDSATSAPTADVCVTGTLNHQPARTPRSYGDPPSGNEFEDDDLANQYSVFVPTPSWVTAFQTATARPPAGSRFLRSVILEGDLFFLSAPFSRVSGSTACGDSFVASNQRVRTLSVVVSVWPQSPASPMPSFPQGGAGIFDDARRAELQQALVAADAHIAIHVLDGTHHEAQVQALLQGSSCRTSDLTACKATYDAIVAFGANPSDVSDDDLAALPGVDWPLLTHGERSNTVVPP